MARSSSYVDLYHLSRIQKGSYDNNLGYIGGYRNIILIQPVLCYHVSSDVGINWKMRMKVQPEIKGFVYEKIEAEM